MIHKIVSVISVGKYRSYNATGDVAFKKLTLLYGNNGGGKTTLTTIFRSVAANDPGHVKRRKSINETTPQRVQIIQRPSTGPDTHHTYNHNTGWSNQLDNVEIFDIHFVNDNIYSGFNFSDDHKKHLHQFVIGAQAVSIQQQIDQNKTDKSTLRQSITTFEQHLVQNVGNNLTTHLIPSFLIIDSALITNIDTKINQAEANVTSANANSIIQTLTSLQPLPVIRSGIDLDLIDSDLQATSQTIQNSALQTLFENHCNNLASSNLEAPESWLQKGFLYIEALKNGAENELSTGVSCPFCQQSIDNSLDIITAYTAQFNTDFNSLVERLKSHLIKVQSFNLELSLQAVKNIDEANIGRIASWAPHLPAGLQQPLSNTIPDETAFKELHQLLIDTITSKLQNPSAAITQTAATSFKRSLQTINGNVLTYNTTVTAYNSAITAFRTSIQTVAQAQAKLEELNRIKLRFDPSISQACIQLIAEKRRLDALERSYRQLNQQQQQAVNTFFSSYKNRVNHYLGAVFKTPFKIEDVTHIPPQGRATYNKIGYKLTIEGHDISFDINQANSAKDCLSEGDKSTIALALFLSKLDIDPTLANKIVIFDDPLSSFDTNRRMYTVQILKDLFPRIKQLIVLSHNEFFLHDISNGIALNDKKTLRISQNYTTNASVIEPLDLDTLVENAYFKNVKELEQILTQPDITKKDTILGLLRNVLEAHIRFKFYRQLAHVPSSHQTFGALITTLDSQGITFRDNTNRVSIISKLKTINSISWKPHHGEPIPDYTTLGVNPSTITETELANFIIDTLKLIDDEI